MMSETDDGGRRMNITEAMRARHSVRQYQDSALAQSACARLQAEIDACNRESGLHIQLIVDEQKPLTASWPIMESSAACETISP